MNNSNQVHQSNKQMIFFRTSQEKLKKGWINRIDKPKLKKNLNN